MKTEVQRENISILNTDKVKSQMIYIRGQFVLLDRNVAEIYGVKTREVNQAMRNNPAKFPDGYVFELSEEEFADWKSKILISKFTQKEKNSIKKGLRHTPKAFTERGLYMLATILKGERATKATIAIIEIYAQIRELARTMESLQIVKDGCHKQQTLLHRTGKILANVIGDNLKTENTETEIEFNFAVVKIRHKIVRNKG